MADHRQEAITGAVNATPALTGVIMWLSGKDINFWVGVAGIAFIGFQALYVAWKWRRDYRRDKASKEFLETLE